MSLSAQPDNACDVVLNTTSTGNRTTRWLHRVQLVLNTARYWRARQWVYLPVRRLLPDLYRSPAQDMPALPQLVFEVDAQAPAAHTCTRDGRLVFLNEVANTLIADVDWRADGKSRLWRYNLHYFEFLADPLLTDAQRRDLIDSWIHENTDCRSEGWEPYPTSLRILSWLRFFDGQQRNDDVVPPSWWFSLYRQYDWLRYHRELHIDANHLLKNCIAIYVASCVFDAESGEEGIIRHRRHVNQLQAALDEQFNRDGGHYERSPMYHLVCLHLCIDAFNAVSKRRTQQLCAREKHLAVSLRSLIERGLGFAAWMQHNEECLAFFNDTADGIALRLDALRRYALSIDASLQMPNLLHGSCWLEQTKYFCWHDDRRHLIVNGGDAHPQYQPGHAHADCLAYELSIDGAPVIVNAGNYCYEASPERDYARSTAAHNTLEIDGENQSELWSVFRLARRARVKSQSPTTGADSVVFTAEHDGYRRFQSVLRHRRDVVITPGSIDFHDSVIGFGEHKIKVFIHLHPTVMARRINNTTYTIANEFGVIAQVDISAAAAVIKLERTPYYPQFGAKQMRNSIAITLTATLPQVVKHSIRVEPHVSVSKEV